MTETEPCMHRAADLGIGLLMNLEYIVHVSLAARSESQKLGLGSKIPTAMRSSMLHVPRRRGLELLEGQDPCSSVPHLERLCHPFVAIEDFQKARHQFLGLL